MNTSARPTKREIDKKISAAKKALGEKRGYFAPISAKLIGEFIELNIGDAEEVWPLIIELLEEIAIDDYIGSRPPMRSYEPNIANCELFAFFWVSKKLQQEMYLKFAIKDGDFYYVSLHKSKKGKVR